MSWTYSSHSSARNGRWNHMAWSRLAIMIASSAASEPWGSRVVSSRVMSEA